MLSKINPASLGRPAAVPKTPHAPSRHHFIALLKYVKRTIDLFRDKPVRLAIFLFNVKMASS
jgi:hypothetical protein